MNLVFYCVLSSSFTWIIYRRDERVMERRRQSAIGGNGYNRFARHDSIAQLAQMRRQTRRSG